MSNQSNITSEYTSTPEEILQAVRKNSIQRGLFFLKNISALDIDRIVQNVEQAGQNYDMEIWREQSSSAGIDHAALDVLDSYDPPVPYPLYFCLPEQIAQNPQLLLYYRNIATISSKVMSNVGLSTTYYEIGNPLSIEKAVDIARHINKIISALVMESRLYGQRRHLELLYTNLGATLDGSWRNEVGRLAYTSIISPIIFRLHQLKKVRSIVYRLKGRIILDTEDDASNDKEQEINLSEKTGQEVNLLLSELEENRVVYRQINLQNGNQVLLNRQLYWKSNEKVKQKFKIGPDLISHTPHETFPWAAELKGGADPAGSDEHWKTASTAFDRIIKAAEKTGRPTPRLSFMATILVDRVAREATLWLQQGKLASIHNLTRIANDPEMHAHFLQQMIDFFEMTENHTP